MRKLGKLTVLCAALLIVIGCVMLGGCHKAVAPDTADGTTTTVEQSSVTTGQANTDIDIVLPDDDGDIIVEIETTGTTNSTGAVTTNPSGTTSSSKVTESTQSSNNASPSKTTTAGSQVSTTRTRQDGWTFDY